MHDDLIHHLDREIEIRANPELVFEHFTDSTRWAAWWGQGSAVEPRLGGAVLIRYPNGVEASGEVLELDAPRRFVFSFGYAGGQPIAVGASRVSIELEPCGPGWTRLRLHHTFADPAVRDQHLQGWRYQLAVFSEVAAAALVPRLATSASQWAEAWSSDDDARRRELVLASTAPGVTFRDRWSNLAGHEDLLAQLAAVRRFMPGSRLELVGDVRACQGVALVDWVIRGADGAETGRGTNVLTSDGEGRILDAVGVPA
jgi:uncharacterized protein YndB with AHSA1/START domain